MKFKRRIIFTKFRYTDICNTCAKEVLRSFILKCGKAFVMFETPNCIYVDRSPL